MGNDNALRLVLRSLCQNTNWNYAVFWKLNGWNQMILGNVASKNNHQWIFAADYTSKLLPQWHTDYQLQFAAGIKTVLLVPVIPLGVVQLGSSQMVMEDPMMVTRVTDLFSILQDTAENFDLYAPFSMPTIEDLSSSSSLSNLVHTIHLPTQEIDEFPNLDVDQLPKNKISSINCLPQVNLSPSEDFLDMSFFTYGRSQMAMCRDLVIDSTLQSACPEHIFEGSSLVIPKFVDGLNEFSVIDNIFATTDPIMTNFYIDDQEHYYNDSMNKRCLDFPLQSDPHITTEFQSLNEYDNHIWNAIMSRTDELSNSICQTEVETIGTLMGMGGTEQLLEGIIANSNYASTDDVSGISRWIRSPSISSVNYPNSSLRHFKSDDHILGFEESVPSRHQTHLSLPKSNVSCLTNEQKYSGNMASMFDKVDSKSSQRSKRRDRNIDSRRPRDRQLIQDRLRELRELIPDGSKCSIDVLLERTVKHMSYLQSIPERAEKLRQSTYRNSKVDDREPQVCPLIVENLDQPGQMLVEMLCKEYGLFLEIVQVIKCLKLTILKGILESRSNELWAHFIVEGGRGFYRMDILLPLMQLLQRN